MARVTLVTRTHIEREEQLNENTVAVSGHTRQLGHLPCWTETPFSPDTLQTLRIQGAGRELAASSNLMHGQCCC